MCVFILRHPVHFQQKFLYECSKKSNPFKGNQTLTIFFYFFIIIGLSSIKKLRDIIDFVQLLFGTCVYLEKRNFKKALNIIISIC